MENFKLCGIQISSNGSVSSNIDKAIKNLNEAVERYSPHLVVFPETVTTGFNPGLSREELWDLLEPNILFDKIEKAAKDLDVHLLWPTYERGKEKCEIYNSAFLYGPDGYIGKYSKTHLFPTERIEHGGWSLPGCEAPVFQLPFAKIGIIICFDGDFPELSLKLAEKGAEVILRPSAFLRSYDIWKLTNRARAYDNHVFVAGINQCGFDPSDTHYYGNSMVVSPVGQILAHARGIEEIICCELDKKDLELVTFGSDEKRIFDHLKDRNKDVK